MSDKQVKTSYGNVKLRRIVIGCVALMAAILLIAYLCISQYYKQHFFAKTYINGMDCSNLTAEEAKEAITTGVKEYVLTITARDGSEQKITGQEIGLNCTFDREVSEVLNDQSAYTWLGNALKDNKLDNPYKLSFDQDKLDKLVKNLNCMAKDKQVAPKDATISEYKEGAGFEIVKEDQGSKLDKSKVTNAVTDSINSLKDKVSLEDAECYKKPSVTSEDPVIKSAMETINKYMQTKLTYKFGDKTDILDGSKIGPAITVDKKYNVSLNQEKIRQYVSYLDKTYSTHGGTWKFKDGNGKEQTVKGGDYGWSLDKSKELKEVMACIEAGEQKDKVAQGVDGMEYGKNVLGNTYVGVNLTTQRIFFIKNGKKIVDGYAITGKPQGGHLTPPGVFSLKDRIYKKTLRGNNDDGTKYESHVNYWMPFNGGIGLHDASWQGGYWGSASSYRVHGSHGCVNLQNATAKAIFGSISVGTPIIVFYQK